jgi:site-specific recombinase XerD
MGDPSRVRVSGPLGPYAAGFATALAGMGYTPVSATFQVQLLAHLSRWLEANGIEPAGLSATVVARLLDARRAAGRTNYLSARAMRPLLEHLRQLGVAPPPSGSGPTTAAGLLLERYHRYLTVERSLAPTTARGYLDAVRPFLAARTCPTGLDLADLTAADITAFVVARCPRQARGSARLTVTALRSLLGFLHLEGILPRSLAAAVPRVASPRLAGLPRGLEPAGVDRLLASCDRGPPTGCRDLAILTLLVRLGLRAGEVAALTLDDIDWRAGELLVRGKGDRSERLPLPVDVGEAIVEHLRRGRPATALGRTVFVRVKAPHRALTSGGVTQVVMAAAQRAGLGHLSAHRLRHTAATAMLRAGSPLAEVGQVLRHRRALTTAIYAKVDREALRALARPWPGGAA